MQRTSVPFAWWWGELLMHVDAMPRRPSWLLLHHVPPWGALTPRFSRCTHHEKQQVKTYVLTHTHNCRVRKQKQYHHNQPTLHSSLSWVHSLRFQCQPMLKMKLVKNWAKTFGQSEVCWFPHWKITLVVPLQFIVLGLDLTGELLLLSDGTGNGLLVSFL